MHEARARHPRVAADTIRVIADRTNLRDDEPLRERRGGATSFGRRTAVVRDIALAMCNIDLPQEWGP